jgi:hypothetical protein
LVERGAGVDRGQVVEVKEQRWVAVVILEIA